MPQNTLRPAHISRNCFKTTRWEGSWPSHQRNSLNLNKRGQAGFGIPLRQASVVLNLPHQWGPLAKCFQIYPQWRSPFVFQNFSCCDQFTDFCWPFDFCFVSCPFLKYVFSFFFSFSLPFFFLVKPLPALKLTLPSPEILSSVLELHPTLWFAHVCFLCLLFSVPPAVPSQLGRLKIYPCLPEIALFLSPQWRWPNYRMFGNNEVLLLARPQSVPSLRHSAFLF